MKYLILTHYFNNEFIDEFNTSWRISKRVIFNIQLNYFYHSYNQVWFLHTTKLRNKSIHQLIFGLRKKQQKSSFTFLLYYFIFHSFYYIGFLQIVYQHNKDELRVFVVYGKTKILSLSRFSSVDLISHETLLRHLLLLDLS